MQYSTILALAAALSVRAQLTVTPIDAGSSAAVATPTTLASVPTTTALAVGTDDADGDNLYTYVVDSLTTVCAEPTIFYYSDVCYTATETSQTITITNCPCTVTGTSTAAAAAASVTSYVAASVTPAPVYVTAGANNVRAVAGGVVGALAVGAAALVL